MDLMRLKRKLPVSDCVFTEKIILENLIHNFDFAKKIIPFLKEEYFHGKIDRLIFSEINSFYEKYSASPTKDAINIQLNKRKDLNESEFQTSLEYLDSFHNDESLNQEWLRDETEEFCKDKAVYNAIMESIQIIDGKSKEKTEGSIPTILSDALSVSFDTHIGHDYIEDSESRFEFYNKTEKKIPFDLEFFNDITSGGTPTKTLNVVMAGTGVGKSMWLMSPCRSLFITKSIMFFTLHVRWQKKELQNELMQIFSTQKSAILNCWAKKDMTKRLRILKKL